MLPSCTELLEVAPDRRDAILRLATELRPGRKVALSTHVNADGDGCGSEVALVRLLGQMGVEAWIVNPTPWPAMFEFLCGDGVRDNSSQGVAALARADVLLVVDISDLNRLGILGEPARALPAARLVIDHHIPSDEAAGDFLFVDTSACATGELVFDFATVLGLTITEPVARALYAAILTDTGGFRFSNTTPRCHAIASQLLAAGVDPEEMYRRIYASVPLGRMQLLRDALATLEVDSELGIAWISVMADSMDKYGLRT